MPMEGNTPKETLPITPLTENNTQENINSSWETLTSQKEEIRISPETIEFVNSKMEELANEFEIDGIEEFKDYAKENNQVYIDLEKVLNSEDWKIKLERYIGFELPIIDELSYENFKENYSEFLVEEKETTQKEDIKEESRIDALFLVLTEKLDNYSWEDRKFLELFLTELDKGPDAVNEFLNKENMAKLLDIAREKWDAKTYNTMVTFFRSEPSLSTTFEELHLAYPKEYPYEFGEIPPLPPVQEAIQHMLWDEDREVKGDMVYSGNIKMNLKDGSRYILSNDPMVKDAYIKTEKVKYETDYGYRLENLRIKKEAEELQVERKTIVEWLNKSGQIIEELKADLEEAKQDLENDAEWMLTSQYKEEISKLEQELAKEQESFNNLERELAEIDEGFEELKKRYLEAKEKENSRVQRYLEKVNEKDEDAKERFEIMRKLWMLTIQPLLVKVQWELNRIRWDLDLWTWCDLVSEVDFESWKFWIKENRYDVLLKTLNVIISWNPDEPMNVNIANSLARWEFASEDYSSPKYMRDQLVKYWMVKDQGYNYQKAFSNLYNNQKSNRNTQKNKVNNEKSEIEQNKTLETVN